MQTLLQSVIANPAAAGATIFCLAACAAWIAYRRRRNRATYFPNAPSQTLKLTAIAGRSCWRPVGIEGRMAMHVSAEWSAENVSSEPAQVLRAYIEKPSAEGVVVLFDRRDDAAGTPIHEIPPGSRADVTVDFWIDPPVKKLGQSFRPSVVFVDQFNNEHRPRRAVCRYESAKEAVAAVDAEWVPEAAATGGELQPIEVQVSAVLREELARYQQCGRRVGGLGSIQTRYGTRVLSGVGSVWRDAEADDGPLVVEDGADAKLESDNAELLIGIYHQLTESDQLRFTSALRRRLGRYGECATVGYLSLLVMFRTGNLREALTTAKAYLRGDDGCAFSDFLLLLDGLLRFEHRRFTEMMLRDVENFLDGIDDYTFGIPDRLVEIRKRRAGIGLADLGQQSTDAQAAVV